MILERKMRKAFRKKGLLRGSLNEFGGMPAKHAEFGGMPAKIWGRAISGRANSKCQGPGEEKQGDPSASGVRTGESGKDESTRSMAQSPRTHRIEGGFNSQGGDVCTGKGDVMQ